MSDRVRITPEGWHRLTPEGVRHTLRLAGFSTNSNTPFRDRARAIRTFMTNSYEELREWGGYAYSGSWWQKLIEHGPWKNGLRPPTDDSLASIAELFATTPERVAEMIAADWYGVTLGIGVSDRMRDLIPLIDGLSDEDASIAASLLRDGVSARTMDLVCLFEGLDGEEASFVEKILRSSSGRARKLVRLIDELGDDDAALAEALILRLSGEEGEE